MPLKKLLAATLTCGMLLSGCYPKGGSSDPSDPKGGPSVPMPKIDLPKSGAPFSPPVTLDPAPAAPPSGNEEVVDMSLG
jgi:hypothetical protein